MIHPTTFRAVLYFLIAFFAPFSDKIIAVLYANQWPSAQIVLGTCLSGTITGLIALRAYYDGSALRNAQDEEEEPEPAPTPVTTTTTDPNKP